MSFQSLEFLYFFLGFIAVYLALLKWRRIQNLWLLAASYFFYAFWDWHFLVVIVGMTGVNYLVGRALDWNENERLSASSIRRALLGIGLFSNFGTLIFFKYLDFFKGGLLRLFEATGLPVDAILVNVIAPIGISFYALQASSYLLDVFNRRIQAARNLLDLALFIAFFPQLLSGPIERAGRLLPQFQKPRRITAGMFSAGIYLVLSGFFKKMVVADNLAKIANLVFNNYQDYAGPDIAIGVLAFTGQLFADFSAYSDIARGLAYLLGIELMVNFRLPYFAASPGEFWQRWHISLSEWLRDYIFYPLRKALLRWKGQPDNWLALLLPPLGTMLVSGLWHGTGWNFLVWGLYHGILLVLYQVWIKEKPVGLVDPSESNRGGAININWIHARRILGTGIRILAMFFLVCFGWLIFRVQTWDQFWSMLTSFSLIPTPNSAALWADLVLFSLPLVGVQLLQQWRGDLLILARLPALPRVLLYAAALALIVVLGVRETSEFIYVQF